MQFLVFSLFRVGSVMLQLAQNLGSHGLVGVEDTFLFPSHDVISFFLDPSHHPHGCTLIELDVPSHRILPLLHHVPKRVIDLYGHSDEDFFTLQLPALPGVVIVDGISRLVARHGVARVMDTILQWNITGQTTAGVMGVVVTVHSDCLSSIDLSYLRSFCNVYISLDTHRLNVANVTQKKSGGKIAKFRQMLCKVRDGHYEVKEMPDKESGAAREGGPVIVTGAGITSNKDVTLPFLKTSETGKMMFDVDDMKIGDYEDNADDDVNNNNDDNDDDPDADLDI